MNNKVYALIFALIILAPLASAAADIGFIVKNSGSPDSVVTSAITEAGYSYEVIDDSKISTTNFANYAMIIIDEGSFGSLADLIPVNTKNSLIMNTYHVDDWNWANGGSDSLGSSQPLSGRVINVNSIITEGVPLNPQLYTQGEDSHGISIPLSYLSRFKRPLTLGGEVAMPGNELALRDYVIATADSGTVLKNGVVNQARGVFFGITETQYWTSNSRTLFKNSIKWLIGDMDQDGDGYKAAVDCNDHDANINPGETDIPYDGIDNDCKNGDERDVDDDNYEAEIVGGNDCNDNNAGVHPGAAGKDKDCVNEAPIFNGTLNKIEWDEDAFILLDFDSYFSDVDKDKLSYSIESTSENDNIILEIFSTGFIKFSSTPDWNGQDWVVIKATDPKNLTVLSNNITLIVNPINDAPVLAPISNILVVEGGIVEIPLNVSDVDGDSLIIETNNDNFVLNETVLSWQTSVGDAGDYVLRVTANDGETEVYRDVNIGIFKKVVINEFVSNPNSGKEWVEIYNPGTQPFDLSRCILEDGSNHELQLESNIQAKKFIVFEYSSSTLNNDGDMLSLMCYGQLTDKVVYGNWDDSNKGIKNNAPAPGKGQSVGRDPDGKDTDNDKNDFKVFEIPTKGMSSNADLVSPVVELLSPENGAFFNETRDIAFEFKGTDNSAQQLVCYLKINGENMNFASFNNGSVGTLEFNGLLDGNYFWNVACYDDMNSGTASSDRTFSISAPDLPTIASISDKIIDEGQKLEFTISSSDTDSTNLTLRAENMPTGASFVDNHDKTGKFRWTPSFTQEGNYTVRFVVRDEDGLESSRNALINVINVKTPITFSDAPECDSKNNSIKITIKDPDDGDDFKIGDKINVKVKLDNDFDEDLDFDVEAHLYDLEEDESVDDSDDSADLNDGDSETLDFELEVPNDAESENYAIYVYAEDDKNRCNSAYVEINVERENDVLEIQNIYLSPQVASPGDNVQVEVDVKNLGADDQKNAYIVVENSELGLRIEGDEFEIEKFDDSDEETETLYFDVPKDAAEKEYPLTVTVYYSGEETSSTANLLVTKKAIDKISMPKDILGQPVDLADYEPLKKVPKTEDDEFETVYREKPKSQVNLNVNGFNRNDLLVIIDIILGLGIIILAIMIRIVSSRR